MFQKNIISSGYLMTNSETPCISPFLRGNILCEGSRGQLCSAYREGCRSTMNTSPLLPSHTAITLVDLIIATTGNVIIALLYRLSWKLIYGSSQQSISRLPFRSGKDLLQVEHVHNLLWDSATTYYVCNNSWYIMTCVIRACHISLGLQYFTGPMDQLWIFVYIPLAAT